MILFVWFFLFSVSFFSSDFFVQKSTHEMSDQLGLVLCNPVRSAGDEFEGEEVGAAKVALGADGKALEEGVVVLTPDEEGGDGDLGGAGREG